MNLNYRPFMLNFYLAPILLGNDSDSWSGFLKLLVPFNTLKKKKKHPIQYIMSTRNDRGYLRNIQTNHNATRKTK